MIRRLLALVAMIVAGVSGAFPAAQSVPAVSADALVARAQEQAAREGKGAMVVFGASWCAPCRGTKATQRPATSPIEIGPDGSPYGVSTTCSVASGRNE